MSYSRFFFREASENAIQTLQYIVDHPEKSTPNEVKIAIAKLKSLGIEVPTKSTTHNEPLDGYIWLMGTYKEEFLTQLHQLSPKWTGKLIALIQQNKIEIYVKSHEAALYLKIPKSLHRVNIIAAVPKKNDIRFRSIMKALELADIGSADPSILHSIPKRNTYILEFN